MWVLHLKSAKLGHIFKFSGNSAPVVKIHILHIFTAEIFG